MSTETTATNRITWTQATTRYSNTLNGKVGKWSMFSVSWDSMAPTGSEDRWVLNCTLPGIKDTLGRYTSEEDAKKKAESVFAYWMKGLETEAK